MNLCTTLFILSICLSCLYSRCNAGFCDQASTCPSTCYKQEKYSTKCGLFGWKRCTRYRSKGYSCTKPCTKKVCCAGYTGGSCNVPICNGITTCNNGGTCVAPNNCRCNTGFAKPRCDDTNECALGTSGCAHSCTNTHGSFRCSCRPGFVLSPNLKSCIDVNECNSNNGGCQQRCINQPGTSYCACNDGYSLNSDANTCSDANECQKGTSKCQHTCVNTVGSYTCQCNMGYTLALNKLNCEDVDECSSGTAKCSHDCNNNIGSYTCSCKDGYNLGADSITCKDLDECLTNNGGCEQTCINEPGSSKCGCHSGYTHNTDRRTCTDIDECSDGVSGCEHICVNAEGSYICSCDTGYTLDSNGKSCNNIDDCVTGQCQHGGLCIDGIATYTCTCTPGYTGIHCQTDINECSFLNGGCQDVCTNTDGSFVCSCSSGTLKQDGTSCEGQALSNDVFRRNKIARRLLPRGCSLIRLTKCTDGKNIEVYLSTTSDWYKLNSNDKFLYTFGIVFVEVNDLSLPISISGVEIDLKTGDFDIKLGASKYKPEDGTIMEDKRVDDCLSVPFTASDIFQFVNSNSFLKSLFDRLFAVLPDWAQLTGTNTSIINVQDLKTDLVYGKDMDQTTSCEGAPVVPEHLYSVFRFDTDFSLSIYGNDVNIPKPLDGRKFCLIIDICHNYGGSVFLMVPEESRDLLSNISILKTMFDAQKMMIKPRGIGLSVVKGVNVHYATQQLQFWNGDHIFKYPVFDRADIWVGGDVEKTASSFFIEGSADIFLSVPRPDRLLTAVFIDEWNSLIQLKASATPTLKFRLFGKDHSIVFHDLGTASIDAYMSIGGKIQRQWCGPTANPPGVFVKGLITVNPFQNIPILKSWVVHFPNTIYGFFTTDPASEITADTKIDIVNDIIELETMVKRFEVLVKDTIAKFIALLTDLTKNILLQLQTSLAEMVILIASNLDRVLDGDFNGLSEILPTLWKQFVKIRTIFTKFLDEVQNLGNIAKDQFIAQIRFEILNIKKNIDKSIKKLTSQVNNAVKDYSGWGVKYRTSLTIFSLELFDIDIELVYSKDSLGQCSRFDKVNAILKGERAMRFLGRLSQGLKLGFFLKAKYGAGIGGAFGMESQTVILQFNAYISMLGIKATGDLFISKKGIYFYLEGNVWDLFLAQIDVSAEVGNQWYDLTYTLKGRFVANARRKRQTQTVSKSFQGSYLDALKKVTQRIANEADKRLSQVQDGVANARNALTKTQDWLESKKEDVRNANSVFDAGVKGLENAKDALEKAKGPFKAAVDRLNKAQKKIDNLCKIKKCRKICIPGLKCKWCNKKVFGVRIPYPCCDWTKCMFEIDDPICAGLNLICKGVRGIAYLALEAAKFFVRIPMAALDLAKGVVSVAQAIVDRSRVVLKLAEGLLDLAKLGVEGAKGVLKATEIALEGVKIIVGAAAKVLEFVIEHGVKNLLDVRNCGFSIEMSTKDLPVFDVSCEVNAFRLGWKTIRLRINFKNILQSIWQAAKATIDTIVKTFKNIFNGRRKREISFEASSKMHILLRKIRQTPDVLVENTNNTINDIIDVINKTLGFKTLSTTDYENRKELFNVKCRTSAKYTNFLKTSTQMLFEIANETKMGLDQATVFQNDLKMLTTEQISNNITIENSGISLEYAMIDYNLTSVDIDKAIHDAKMSFSTDPLMLELISTAHLSQQMINNEVQAVQSVQLINHWIVAAENITRDHFNSSECTDIRDCIFYSISNIYELYSEDKLPHLNEIHESISLLESSMLDIIQNTSANIETVFQASHSIIELLNKIESLSVFCSTAPTFSEARLTNQTASGGSTVTFICDASSNPRPQFWWFKDGEVLISETNTTLVLRNVTTLDAGVYSCVAGNIVANLTSNEAHLIFWEKDDDQALLEEECLQHECQRTSLCYLPHPTSCFKFIMCQSSEIKHQRITAKVMPCAFGTMWNNTKQACESIQEVKCENDPCRSPTLNGYVGDNANCRTYYRCEHGRSVPDCCPPWQRYNTTMGKCAVDNTYTSPCPLLNEETCKGGSMALSQAFDDGNCKTYMDCTGRHLHPVCCPGGQGFNAHRLHCTNDKTCNDTCPTEYQNLCSKRGVSSYDLIDGNCRTFMQCNSKGQDDAYCCKSHRMYNPVLKKCTRAIGFKCLRSKCPKGYIPECRFEAVHGKPNQFINMDAPYLAIQACAPGASFNQEACQCITQLKDITSDVCLNAIDIRLPSLKNFGDAVASIDVVGDFGPVPRFVRRLPTVWTGTDGINIPYYGGQTLKRFYLEMLFTPKQGNALKQILVSNCLNEDNFGLTLPTMELALMRFDSSGGIVKIQVREQDLTQMIELDAPITFDVTYKLKVIYDGKHVGVILHDETTTHNNVHFQTHADFSGTIPIQNAGLRFAACGGRNNKNYYYYDHDGKVSSFVGLMKEIKFSKCLTTEMKAELLLTTVVPV